jgi:hypothetical protein
MAPQPLRIRHLTQVLDELANVDPLCALPGDQPFVQVAEPAQQGVGVAAQRGRAAAGSRELTQVGRRRHVPDVRMNDSPAQASGVLLHPAAPN